MMSENKIERFRFSYNYGDYDDVETFETSVEFKCEDAHITDVIERFEQFLRGCGFCYDGELVQVDFKKYDLVERNPKPVAPKDYVTVTRNADQGINITNTDGVAAPVYPDEGFDAWGKAVEKARREADEASWSRGQTAV
jgi:hypothetical protein